MQRYIVENCEMDIRIGVKNKIEKDGFESDRHKLNYVLACVRNHYADAKKKESVEQQKRITAMCNVVGNDLDIDKLMGGEDGTRIDRKKKIAEYSSNEIDTDFFVIEYDTRAVSGFCRSTNIKIVDEDISEKLENIMKELKEGHGITQQNLIYSLLRDFIKKYEYGKIKLVDNSGKVICDSSVKMKDRKSEELVKVKNANSCITVSDATYENNVEYEEDLSWLQNL